MNANQMNESFEMAPEEPRHRDRPEVELATHIIVGLEAERDLLRERERELVEALEQVRATGYKKAGGGFWMIPNETIELVRAALAKHGR